MAATLDPRFDTDTEAQGLMATSTPRPPPSTPSSRQLAARGGGLRPGRRDRAVPDRAGPALPRARRVARRLGHQGAQRPRRHAAGFRVVGAHTDSPNLRIKPNPDSARVGWQQLGVEVYGGAAARLLARPRPRALGPGRRARRRRRPAARHLLAPAATRCCGWPSSPSTSTAPPTTGSRLNRQAPPRAGLGARARTPGDFVGCLADAGRGRPPTTCSAGTS